MQAGGTKGACRLQAHVRTQAGVAVSGAHPFRQCNHGNWTLGGRLASKDKDNNAAQPVLVDP